MELAKKKDIALETMIMNGKMYPFLLVRQYWKLPGNQASIFLLCVQGRICHLQDLAAYVL